MQVVAAFSALFLALADGTAPGAATCQVAAEDAYVEEVLVERVRWPAIVDRQRKAPRDACAQLAPADFIVTEDGRPARVTSVSVERGSTLFIFLLDVSSSMLERLRGVKEAAIKFAATLAPLDEVTVLTFSRGVQQIVPPTRDPGALEAALERIDVGEAFTAMADAAWDALDRFSGHAGREVLVLFTDAAENASERHDIDELIRRAGRSPDLRVFPVLTVSHEDFRTSAPLRWLAEASAGGIEIVQYDYQLHHALRGIQERLMKEVLLTYAPPERAADPGPNRRIKVTIRPRPGLPCKIAEGASARTLTLDLD